MAERLLFVHVRQTAPHHSTPVKKYTHETTSPVRELLDEKRREGKWSVVEVVIVCGVVVVVVWGEGEGYSFVLTAQGAPCSLSALSAVSCKSLHALARPPRQQPPPGATG